MSHNVESWQSKRDEVERVTMKCVERPVTCAIRKNGDSLREMGYAQSRILEQDMGYKKTGLRFRVSIRYAPVSVNFA